MKKIVIIILGGVLLVCGLMMLGHSIYLTRLNAIELKNIENAKGRMKKQFELLDERMALLRKQQDESLERENSLWKIRREQTFGSINASENNNEDESNDKYELLTDEEDYHKRRERIIWNYLTESHKIGMEYLSTISKARKLIKREEELRGHKVEWDFVPEYPEVW